MKRARTHKIQKPTAKKKGNPNKALKIWIISLISILLIGFTAVDAWQFKKDLDKALNFWGIEQPDGEDNYLALLDDDAKKINVLVLGLDNEGLRSDTIMILSYDTEAKTLNLLSIPRDTRMYVGKGYQKINAAYQVKNSKGQMSGPHGTIEAVTRLTGIPIHYYVEFNFDTFKETIDILGGVWFDVPQRMKYSDLYQDLYIDLESGMQLLDGDKAEQFVRFRHYPMGDLARIEAQQAFLNALIDQKLNKEIIDKIPEMFDMIKDNINTNFTPIEVAKYAMSLTDLPRENIKMYNLPGRFSEKSEYTASYWLPKMEKKNDSDEEIGVKELVGEVFGYPDEAEYATTGPKKEAVDKADDDEDKDEKKSQTTDKKESSKKTNSNSDSKKTDKSTTSADKKTSSDKNSSSSKNTSKTDSKKTDTEKEDNKKTDDDDSKTTTDKKDNKTNTDESEPIEIPDTDNNDSKTKTTDNSDSENED